MWTTHVAWLLGLILAAWIAYRVGYAVASGRADDEIDDLTTQSERHTAEMDAARQRITRLKENATHWKCRWREQWQENQRLIERLLPSAPESDDTADDPLTVAQADRQVVEERRREARAEREARAALERESASVDFEGMEPLAIADDEAMPVPRLDAREGDEHG